MKYFFGWSTNLRATSLEDRIKSFVEENNISHMLGEPEFYYPLPKAEDLQCDIKSSILGEREVCELLGVSDYKEFELAYIVRDTEPEGHAQVHNDIAEVFLITGGQVFAEIGDEKISVGPGVGIKVPVRTPHKLSKGSRYVLEKLIL